jgi:hypothetical protein
MGNILGYMDFIHMTQRAIGRALGQETVECPQGEQKQLMDKLRREGYTFVPLSGGVRGNTAVFNVRRKR